MHGWTFLEYNYFTPSVGLQGAMRTQLNSHCVLFSLSHCNISSAAGLRVSNSFLNPSGHSNLQHRHPHNCETVSALFAHHTTDIDLPLPSTFHWEILNDFRKWVASSALTSPFLPPTRKHTHTDVGRRESNKPGNQFGSVVFLAELGLALQSERGAVKV